MFKWAILISFSLTNLFIDLRVLVLKELGSERWESDVFIDIKNKACEKTSLPLNRKIGCFIRWFRNYRFNRRIDPERTKEHHRFQSVIGGFITADHNRRNRPERLNRPGLIDGFERWSWLPDHNPEMLQNLLDINGGFIRRSWLPIKLQFHHFWWNQRRSQGHSPKAIVTPNQPHQCACADVSKQF